MELNASSFEILCENLALLCDPVSPRLTKETQSNTKKKYYLRVETFNRFIPLVKAASARATST